MSATVTYALGRVVWREVFTRDLAAARRFYGDMFGWTTEERPMGPDWSYVIWKHGEAQVGGMMDIAAMPGGGEGIPPHWAIYVSVADVDATAARAVAAGAKVLGDCHDIPGVGQFAVLQDPQGGHFNLFRSEHGDPAEGPVPAGQFCWESLATTDVAKAVAFYTDVIGWGTQMMGEMTLFTRQAGGEAVTLASTGEVPPGQPPAWSSFVAVDDTAAAVARCRELGGEVWLDKTEIPGVGWFALFADPMGAPINVFEAIKA